jgi:xylose isomerase
MTQFKFSAGPWNIHEGADSFGPVVRSTISLAEKIKKLKQLGFDAIQFHDDDVVANIDEKSHTRRMADTKEVKKVLSDNGLEAEFVAPRLWECPQSIDGALSSNSETDRKYCIDRGKGAIDIANELGAGLIGFWFAREGTVCPESKNPVEGWKRLLDGLNQLLAYDKKARFFIEPKPNEPIDRSFCPTMGHAMALASQTIDPSRVGGLMESAHAILAGLDPAHEIATAIAFGKLFGVHLNDQNGLKFDQDKTFGAENLRQSFNQVKLLVENNFGSNGEFIGLDVKAMRTQKQDRCYQHLENSMKIVKILEEKALRFDYKLQKQFVDTRDYESLEMYVIELLTGII